MYRDDILAVLQAAPSPLTLSEIVPPIKASYPEEKYAVYARVGAELARLVAEGLVDRELINRKRFRYRLASAPATIRRGYTWQDQYGPIRVMAVAEGYAMCRGPGAIPFVVSLKEMPTPGLPPE